MSAEATFVSEAMGATCHALMRQEHWYQGEPSSLWNVLFLQVAADKWLRFFFDAGVFFWRSAPQPDCIPKHEDNTYQLTSVREATPILGQVITRVVFTDPDALGRELVIEFSGGSRLRLANTEDENQVVFA